MKKLIYFFLALILCWELQTIRSVAESENIRIAGKFEFLAAGGPRYIEFSAELEKDGRVTGETIFRNDKREPASKGEAQEAGSALPLFIRANLDCMEVRNNRAVMSGEITEASSDRYIGKRLLLAVQHRNPGDSRSRDKFTWGVYRTLQNDWPASDTERSEDPLGDAKRLVTDSERDDDAGVLSGENRVVGCQSFPLSSFTFIDSKQGRGVINVWPQRPSS